MYFLGIDLQQEWNDLAAIFLICLFLQDVHISNK